LQENGLDNYLEIFNAIISFLLASSFAITTYFDVSNPRDNLEEPKWISYFEVILMLIIMADYLLYFFLSEHRIPYIFSWQSFITYASIVPTGLIRL